MDNLEKGYCLCPFEEREESREETLQFSQSCQGGDEKDGSESDCRPEGETERIVGEQILRGGRRRCRLSGSLVLHRSGRVDVFGGVGWNEEAGSGIEHDSVQNSQSQLKIEREMARAVLSKETRRFCCDMGMCSLVQQLFQLRNRSYYSPLDAQHHRS